MYRYIFFYFATQPAPELSPLLWTQALQALIHWSCEPQDLRIATNKVPCCPTQAVRVGNSGSLSPSLAQVLALLLFQSQEITSKEANTAVGVYTDQISNDLSETPSQLQSQDAL
ncbi:hypothetical protein FOVSG1_012626 [Fusarium oxysporum f. sp. vasinfectum]